MALEKRWLAVPAQTVALQGDECGVLQVANACLFKVKMKVRLTVAGETLIYEVKRVNSNTELELGDPAKNINHRSDLTYVSPGALLEAHEQERSTIPVEDVVRAVYEEDPAMALRSMLVDRCGNAIGQDPNNPLTVQLSDGSIDIGTVNADLSVQLSRKDDDPDAGDIHDSIRIGNQDYELLINPDGSINVLNTEGVPSLEIRRDVINNISYTGIANPGSDTPNPVWKIARTIKTNNNTSSGDDEVTLVAGTGQFNQIWDNRASLFPATTPIEFTDRRFERLLPILANANFLKLGDYDRVVPSFSDEAVTMNYFEDDVNIARATIRYINDLDWEINLERYINDENGDLLLDDDGTPLNLD